MKILVTGNMGYIGPSVVNQLKASYPNVEIIGFDIGYFAHCLTNANVFPESKLDIQYFGDIRKFPEHILDGVDSIVHLAAISNDPMGNVNEQLTLDVNYKASVDLAKKAKKHGVKSFVFASSCSVYGAGGAGDRTEESEVNPLTPYAKSKVFTERDLKELAFDDFKVTCLRFSTACGMSERIRLDLVLNDFVASALTTKKIEILSDGSPWRPLINIKDMARAIDWAISRKISNGGSYLIVNVGSNEWNYQIKDLAKATAEVIPGVDVFINEKGEPDKRSYKVSFNMFQSLAPNHQPEWNLLNTIQDLQNGLNAMHFNDSKFRDSNLIRLKVLEGHREKNRLNNNYEWVNLDKVLVK